MNRFATASILLAGLAVAAGCQQKNEFVPPPPPAVTVAKPLERAVTDYFETTGNTRAVQTVELRARVEGYLERIEFRDGELVSEGDLLFVIDKEPFEVALASAEAQLAKADAQLNLAEAQQGRTKALVERKAATKDQLDVADAERASAAASVASAKAAIRQAALDLDFTEIRAPFAGRMGRHQVDVGNLVETGSTLLATLEAVDPIHAYFNVSESELLRFLETSSENSLQLSDANPVTIELAIGEIGDYAYRGRLDFSEFGVDPTTGTTMRRAVFDNPEQRLLPGLFVRVRAAVGDPRPRLLVEERAISSDQRGDYLLVVNDKNVVEYRPVRLGRADAGLRIVEDGLDADDWVVVNGLQRARPGAPVQPEQAQMAANLTKQPTAFVLSPTGAAVVQDDGTVIEPDRVARVRSGR